MTTHYETLGVSETATPDEIKKAYRKLASKHHPDKGGDTAVFQQVEEAYRVLSDPRQRQQYDMERQGGARSFRFNTSGSDFDINDLFGQFGFGGASPFGQRQPRRNKDLRIELVVELQETLQDQKKTISVQTTNGQRQTLEVTIPRGITSGASMKYPGLGDNFFASLPRGDLYVNFRVIAHPQFQVYDIDLITKIEINCFDAITGGETEVVGLDGKTFLTTIPPGTQPGTKLRIKGEGLYVVNQPHRGNLIVEIRVSIPTNLTQTQLDLVKTIQSNQ
jgi:DnaJ-class molecular chaperone